MVSFRQQHSYESSRTESLSCVESVTLSAKSNGMLLKVEIIIIIVCFFVFIIFSNRGMYIHTFNFTILAAIQKCESYKFSVWKLYRDCNVFRFFHFKK